MAKPLFNQVTIVGTGLIGASLGLALKDAAIAQRIVGVGRGDDALRRARERGAVDDTTTDLPAAAAQSDLLILAAPLGQFPAIFTALADLDRPDLIITDVGSTKANVCELAEAHLRHPQRFVGSHPMAGSEQQGPDAATADLFQGKPCVITPQHATDPLALARVNEFWASLGMRLCTMSPAEHDRKVAIISHLPHLAAVLLVELAQQHDALDVASTGLADTTRIASADPTIRRDIYTANRDAILTAIDALQAHLADARTRIATGDDAELHQWLTDIKQIRDNLNH